MKNPGIDTTTWEGLQRKWSELEAAGHKLKVEFKLITDPKDKSNVLAIDVIQHVDEEIVTETVQRKAGGAYEAIGIAGLSMERLVAVYKDMIEQLHRQQTNPSDTTLAVTMSPSSETSGEIRGYVQKAGIQSSMLVTYQHYYVLNALREKMIAMLNDEWSMVRAVYRPGAVDFYFDY